MVKRNAEHVVDEAQQVTGQEGVGELEEGGEVIDVGARREDEHLADDDGDKPGDGAIPGYGTAFAEEEAPHLQPGEVPRLDEDLLAPDVDVAPAWGGYHRD